MCAQLEEIGLLVITAVQWKTPINIHILPTLNFENVRAKSAHFWVIQAGSEYIVMEEQRRMKYCCAMGWGSQESFSSWESVEASVRWKAPRVTTAGKSRKAVSYSQYACSNDISKNVRNCFKPEHSGSESQTFNRMLLRKRQWITNYIQPSNGTAVLHPKFAADLNAL